MSVVNFLQPDEGLVYIASARSFSETVGVTHIAKILSTFTEDQRSWTTVQLLTDNTGNVLEYQDVRTVTTNALVSNRAFKPFTPRMYHFARTPSTSVGSYTISATNMVNVERRKQPLSSTSITGLGSGIYGLYLPPGVNIDNLRARADQEVYEITMKNPYFLQDKEHGASFSLAALHTQRYLERIINAVRADPDFTRADVLALIELNPSHHILRLWNIVFYRTHQHLSLDNWHLILTDYVMNYLTGPYYVDTETQDSLQVQPTNYILTFFGHDGVLAQDVHNNHWNRGAVSYDLTIAERITSNQAAYELGQLNSEVTTYWP